jgi:hypothetical protein
MNNTNQINNNSLTRMTRGLELLEQGVKIVENENGSFNVPSLKIGFVIVQIFNLEKLSFVNIFTLLKHGLLLSISKKNQSQKYLQMIPYNAINVVL